MSGGTWAVIFINTVSSHSIMVASGATTVIVKKSKHATYGIVVLVGKKQSPTDNHANIPLTYIPQHQKDILSSQRVHIYSTGHRYTVYIWRTATMLAGQHFRQGHRACLGPSSGPCTALCCKPQSTRTVCVHMMCALAKTY